MSVDAAHPEPRGAAAEEAPAVGPASTGRSSMMRRSMLGGGGRRNSVGAAVGSIIGALRINKPGVRANGKEVDFETMMAGLDVTRERVHQIARERSRGADRPGGRWSALVAIEGSMFMAHWDALLAIVALYTLLEAPVFVAFGLEWRVDSGSARAHLVLSVLALLVSLCNAGVCLLTCPPALARSTTSIEQIVDHNLGGPSSGVGRWRAALLMLLRLSAAVPFELLGSGSGAHAVHVLRGAWLYSYIARYSAVVSHLRLLQMVLIVLLQLHYVGCGWWILAQMEAARVHAAGGVESSWLDDIAPLMDGSQSTTYLLLIMHASYMLVGTIVQRGLLTRTEYLVSSLIMVLGLITAGVIVSGLTMYLNQLNSSRVTYQRKLDATRSSMARMSLPPPIRSRVLHYYERLWSTYGSFELDQSWLQDLNPVLRADIHIFQFRHIVRAVPFFANSTSPQLITATVQELKRELYIPGDIVVVKGAPGRALYFVTTGDLSVVVENEPPPESKRPRVSYGGFDPLGGMVMRIRKHRQQSANAADRRSGFSGFRSRCVSAIDASALSAAAESEGGGGGSHGADSHSPSARHSGTDADGVPTDGGAREEGAADEARPADHQRTVRPPRWRWPGARPKGWRSARVEAADSTAAEAAAEAAADAAHSTQLLVVKELNAGDYFGEISILDPNYRAAAFVVASTFVDTRALLAESFRQLRHTFPELEAEVRKSIQNTEYAKALDTADKQCKRTTDGGPGGTEESAVEDLADEAQPEEGAAPAHARAGGAAATRSRLDAVVRTVDRLVAEQSTIRRDVSLILQLLEQRLGEGGWGRADRGADAAAAVGPAGAAQPTAAAQPAAAAASLGGRFAKCRRPPPAEQQVSAPPTLPPTAADVAESGAAGSATGIRSGGDGLEAADVRLLSPPPSGGSAGVTSEITPEMLSSCISRRSHVDL